jgi:hypothetical protein
MTQPDSQNHVLNSFPEYFEATITKQKTHELRKNTPGLDFNVNDTIFLQEFDPVANKLTGRTANLVITFISPSPKSWLVPGYTLMSTRLADSSNWYDPRSWFKKK